MAPKFKEFERQVIIENFEYTVVVVMSNDIHQSARNRKMAGVEPKWYACHAGAANAPVSFIFLPIGAPPEVVAHESFHCVWHMMQMLGCEFEEEVIAYNLSYLTREIFKLQAATKRKPKKRPKKSKLPKVKIVSASKETGTSVVLG